MKKQGKALNQLFKKVDIETETGNGKVTKTDFMSAAILKPIEDNPKDAAHNMARLGITKIHDGLYSEDTTGGNTSFVAYSEEPAQTEPAANVKGSVPTVNAAKGRRPTKESKALQAAATAPSGLGPKSVETPGVMPPATDVEAANGGNLPEGQTVQPGTENAQ